MRLYKCPRVEKHLQENGLMDERKAWCYAQASVELQDNIFRGLVLVCVKGNDLFLYAAEFNTTRLDLFYSCALSEMQNVSIKKRAFSTRLSFQKDAERVRLDLDDWKRFERLFEEI